MQLAVDLLGSSEKELQQRTQRLEKTAAEHGMGFSFDKSKILVNSIKAKPSANIKMNEQTLEEVDQLKYFRLHTNQRRKFSKKSEDQTGTSTLSHDMAGNSVEKQSHKFSHKDYTL